jgi:hypothetical protein
MQKMVAATVETAPRKQCPTENAQGDSTAKMPDRDSRQHFDAPRFVILVPSSADYGRVRPNCPFELPNVVEGAESRLRDALLPNEVPSILRAFDSGPGLG